MQNVDSSSPSLKCLGRTIMIYGVFLFLVGLAGYLSNPAAAKTALISGGVFGSTSIGLGLLIYKGLGVFKWVTLGMVGFLSIIFGWRSAVSWIAVSQGEPKLIAALLISSMLLASLLMVVRILLAGKPCCGCKCSS